MQRFSSGNRLQTKIRKRPFIKKYRTRYQTLQKSASINPKLTKKDMKILKKFVLLKRTII